MNLGRGTLFNPVQPRSPDTEVHGTQSMESQGLQPRKLPALAALL